MPASKADRRRIAGPIFLVFDPAIEVQARKRLVLRERRYAFPRRRRVAQPFLAAALRLAFERPLLPPDRVLLLLRPLLLDFDRLLLLRLLPLRLLLVFARLLPAFARLLPAFERLLPPLLVLRLELERLLLVLFCPPFRAEAVEAFFPRPEPDFLPPPDSLFTVAHARRFASFAGVPCSS